MDPSSISSPSAPATNAVPFAVEPNNHLPSPSSNHPPYAEMIYTAIEALKEKNGSSKRAISKYIEQVYRHQLPPPESHSNLLTHHLKRLKSDGLLQTIKNSYIIPRSIPPPASTEPPSTASPSQPSKPRGRPRKSVTPSPAQAQPQDNFIPQPLPLVVANNDNNNAPLQNAEPVWAALGLSDDAIDVQAAAATPEGTKRRPGRPPGSKNVSGLKNATAPSPSQNPTPIEGQVPPTPASRGRGRPPGSKSKSKRKPGRPPKVNPDTPTPAVASDGTKRRPGRPPKNQQQNPTPIPFATTLPETEVPQPQVAVPEVAVLTPRSRGRPRKNPAVAAVPVAVVAGGGRGRGRGRGGRGRPGRIGHAFGGITLRAPGKRPVGRPKKGTAPATASASQNAANEVDLRRKLEHFQGKIKESLAVIKPHFDHESPVTALAAIQELEILGAMDLNEPLNEEPLPSQPNVPAQDQPQQSVAQPQVFAQYPPFHTQDRHNQQQQSQYQYHP
ncbi:unnamed protein product [Lathyrus sativus]|nr:unnamed protein product [Lathyrus sativus]